MPEIVNRQKMNEQPPEVRVKNFGEVALGFDDETAKIEAERCLNCKNAKCIGGCPVGTNIPLFIDWIKKGEVDKAFFEIRKNNRFPGICGRVCPQEEQCEKFCVRNNPKAGGAVAIGALERYAADFDMKKSQSGGEDKRVNAASVNEKNERVNGENFLNADKNNGNINGENFSAPNDKNFISVKENDERVNAADFAAKKFQEKENGDINDKNFLNAAGNNGYINDKNSASVGAERNAEKKVLKAAVVGSGPASLTVAGELAANGFSVTVFEAFHKAGGVLVYGIPEFRLPKALVQAEIDALIRSGVEIKTNVVIGKTLLLEDLIGEFDAVFVGTGAGLPVFLNIEGENLNGVYSANEFLTRINLMKAYEKDAKTPVFVGKKVAVVGAGNVAMDAARTALRLGADVHIVYRRGRGEMPARREEIHHAEEEGVDFQLLTAPLEILGANGRVEGMKCIKMRLGETDEKGRRSPIPIEGSEFILECDEVIVALGTGPNPIIKNSTDIIRFDSRGRIVVDEAFTTSNENVYAAGDAVTGAATVILAMGNGKTAARAIIEKLKDKN